MNHGVFPYYPPNVVRYGLPSATLGSGLAAAPGAAPMGM
jgi:hypothetical protein